MGKKGEEGFLSLSLKIKRIFPLLYTDYNINFESFINT